MLHILINSYTCCPDKGSEPGMGWNWITSLAKYCEIFVISEGEYRPQVEEWLAKKENEALAGNMHFYWNPVTEKVRKMCWNQGDWRFYKYYRDWQKKTAEIVVEICKKEKIDILHQLNMIGFREPGYLWKVAQDTGIPYIWGPVDAKGSFPMEYTDGASFKVKLKLNLKNLITWTQLRYSKRVHKAARNASFVIGASSNSVAAFKKIMDIDAVLINETGCQINEHIDNGLKSGKSTLDLLWVGKTDFRKQLGIAIHSLAKSCDSNIWLHVVGGGDIDSYRKLAEKLKVSERIIWYGPVSHDKVRQLMLQSDLLLFTSVAEGTPHVVMESLANGLPILCHDTCGQGDCVTSDVGFKVPLTTPDESVERFSSIINYITKNRDALLTMSKNCISKSRLLSWDNKAQTMFSLYQKAIEQRH